jgi:hypothetical protein
MRRSSLEVVLSDDERRRLEHVVRCSTSLNGHAQRARAVLAFADGRTMRDIGRRFGMGRRIVRKWVARFVAKRLDALDDMPRSGRPPVFSPRRGDARGEDRLRAAG